jgi:uncharacterized membrane protein
MIIKQFLIMALAMLMLDALWLTLRFKYHNALFKAVQHSEVEMRIIPAALIYLVIPAAVLYFAVLPSKSPKEAAINGALLGASIYSVYDLTNLATLKGWTIEMTITDILWGTTVCTLGAFIGAYVKK